MPNIKSQIKRVEVSALENERNTAKKTKVKNSVKRFNAAVEANDVASAEKYFREAVKLINEAKSDGIYHKNTAARKVATLSKLLDALKASAPVVEAKPAKVAKVEEVAAPVEEKKVTKRAPRKKAE